MLQSLSVKNFAIIDNIQVDFTDKMTVLTGETGAGKSLIIDAIGLLFGDRASSEQVRHGQTKAIIEGIFEMYSPKVNEILLANGITTDDFLVVKREIYSNGKSLSKINGEICTLNVLSEVSNELGDIHSQFDAIKLINPKSYFDFLDDGRIKELVSLYQSSLKDYKVINNEYQEKKRNETLKLQKLDFLKYQLNELEKANLNFEEELELQNQLKILNNYEKISTNYFDFLNSFDSVKVLDNIYEAINAIKKNCQFDESLKEKVTRLEESYYNIEDIYNEIKNNLKGQEFDVNEFNAINERLQVYSTLKRKYKLQTVELINLYNEIKKEVNELENYDFYLDELNKKKNILFDKTFEIGKAISEKRRQNALSLKENLLSCFKELSLNNTTFDIIFNEIEKNDNTFKANGIDVCDFLISFNKGEPLKPLAKVASGGELSRFMLAIKAVSCSQMLPKTFIFDEIDSGVSGEIAYSIASKIKNISEKHQVLCVTHLPQVAGISDNHLHITKSIVDEKDESRTITNIENLNYDQRIEIIALMISKGQVTKASYALAKELLSINS